MYDFVEDILNEEHMKDSIRELEREVIGHFDKVDAVIMIWEKDGEIHHRAFGSSTELVGLLNKAMFILMRQSLGDTREPE